VIPGNPVVGSTVLRRPAIQSPNFVQSPLAGWAINADGTAYFADVTVAGAFEGTDFVINASGAFFYSGTPASGNLLISVAPVSGTDAYGNSYADGITIYHGTADFQLHVNQTENVPAIEMPTGVTSEADHAAIYTLASGSGATQEMNTAIIGAGSTFDGVQAGIFLNSAEEGGGNGANIVFQLPLGTDTFYVYANGIHCSQPVYGTGGTLTVGDNIAATGKAITCQSVTTAGDAQVQGAQLAVGNGSSAAVVLNPKQGVNAAATHISTTPTSAEFNSVVDLINSIRSAGINIGFWS
jgi:hypothetical protein